VRVRDLIEPLGFDGGKSIVDDYLREDVLWGMAAACGRSALCHG
jgi:hypothetical protein